MPFALIVTVIVLFTVAIGLQIDLGSGIIRKPYIPRIALMAGLYLAAIAALTAGCATNHSGEVVFDIQRAEQTVTSSSALSAGVLISRADPGDRDDLRHSLRTGALAAIEVVDEGHLEMDHLREEIVDAMEGELGDRSLALGLYVTLSAIVEAEADRLIEAGAQNDRAVLVARLIRAAAVGVLDVTPDS